MKRSELRVGAKVAYIGSKQRFNEKPIEVTVLSIDPWERRNSYPYGIREAIKGNGVLVEGNFRPWMLEESLEKKVLQLSALVGDYQDAKSRYDEVEARVAEARRVEEVKRAENQRFRQEVYAPAFHRFKRAVQDIKSGSPLYASTKLEDLDVEVLDAITDALTKVKHYGRMDR